MPRCLKSMLAGVLAASLCLCAASWSKAREDSIRLKDIEEETRLVARQFATRIRSGLEKHRIALQQMARFLDDRPAATQAEFSRLGAATLGLTPLFIRISEVDASLRVRRVHPLEANRSIVGFDVRSHPRGLETVLRAKRTRGPALSPPLTLLDGPQGFVLAAPVFRAGVFGGAVVGTFRSSDFFRAMVLPEALERYEQRILDSGTTFFDSGPSGPSGPPVPVVGEKFDFGGRTWELRVQPRATVVQEGLRTGRAAFWTLAWLLALAAGGIAGAGASFGASLAARFRSQRLALDEARQRLDGAMQQLLQAEKLTALGELVAGVAHEINNPLSSIMGYSQLLMARDLPQEVKRRLETIVSEAERMAKIVKNLLTFARKHAPEKRYIGLNGVIEKTLELKAYHFRVNQIRVEKDLAADLPMTMLDFHQIQQVIINLLNNAEQAMAERGGGVLRITTHVAGGRIEARLSDDGPGIPPEIQARVFEPFFTTKKEGKGTGLGLSLCYGIMQEHGGSIRVESRAGHGATFILDLPVTRAPGAVDKAATAAAAVSTSRLRVLIIDDEQSLQNFLVEFLTSAGHSVDTASDVPEALRKIAANGHDLIISDIKMPRGSGKDIYRAVVEKSPRLARRIVFTTGDGASAETRRFLEETGNEVVLKPFRIEDLRQAIARAIGN